MSEADDNPAPRLRLDKWLWRARLYKTRALAAAASEGGKIRVNGARRTKPGAGVKCGDVLTIARPSGVLLLRIEDFGERRGPATEARTLYTDLDAAQSGLASAGGAVEDAADGDPKRTGATPARAISDDRDAPEADGETTAT